MSRIEFDPDTIRSLAIILQERGLTEIELRDGDTHLRLVRTPAPTAALAPTPTQVVVNQPAAAPSLVHAGEEPLPAGAITSPMVGIAYLASEPGAPPYITVGQTVVAGQTLLLIEAMKTFNQIKAPRGGTISQILIQGGVPVEYGQPLLVIA